MVWRETQHHYRTGIMIETVTMGHLHSSSVSLYSVFVAIHKLDEVM